MPEDNDIPAKKESDHNWQEDSLDASKAAAETANAFLMKNQHIDSTPEEKKMPAMSDTEDYEVRESDESIQSSETEEDYYMTSTGVTAEEQFAEEIKNDVLKHDWDALSEKNFISSIADTS